MQRYENVQFLLDMGADGFSPGIIWFDMEKLVEAKGVLNTEFPKEDQPSTLSFLPIHWACRAHDSRMIKMLLENGTRTPDWPEIADLRWDPSMYEDVDLKLMDSPQLFRKNKSSDKLHKIMDNMFRKSDGLGDVLSTSRSLLSYASDPFPRSLRLVLHGNRIQNELENKIDLLLRQPGQKADRVDWVGRTSFLVGCYNNDTETIKYLLSRPEMESPMLEKSWQGGWGMKPLHNSVWHANLLSVRSLLDKVLIQWEEDCLA